MPSFGPTNIAKYSFSLSLSIYIYIYTYICVCACEKNKWKVDNTKQTTDTKLIFRLYFIKDFISRCLCFGLSTYFFSSYRIYHIYHFSLSLSLYIYIYIYINAYISVYICIYIYIYWNISFVSPDQWLFGHTSCVYHHHHHGVPVGRISLNLSGHSSQSSIAHSRSSMLHPVSLQSCCR